MNSSHGPVKKKKAKNYIPFTDRLWWYNRNPVRHDNYFHSLLDDLYWHGFIDKQPFYSKYEDWSNLTLKNIVSEFIHEKSERSAWQYFGSKNPGRRNYRYNVRMNHYPLYMEFRQKYDIESYLRESNSGSSSLSESDSLSSNLSSLANNQFIHFERF